MTDSPLPAIASPLAIPDLHDKWTSIWHQQEAAAFSPATGPLAMETEIEAEAGMGRPSQPIIENGTEPASLPVTLATLVESQHRANYDLWHTEDRARAPRATSDELAELKRCIDRINQRRNDLTEQIDALLLAQLVPLGLPLPTAELHSESPGLMIDRLSILALKLFHTREELIRPDAPPLHAERNRARLAILVEQREDLALCLNRLWILVHTGERRFKIYRQLKMYNDPTLNPILYTAPGPLKAGK